VKFLVVGGSGFLGRHLRAEAARQGFAAHGTTTRPNPPPGLVRFDLAEDRPITDAVPASFFADGGPVWVVVCACVTPMDRCRTEWDYAYRVNVANTTRLIDDACRLGARVVFTSTSYVFDGSLGYYPEDWPHSPASAYGEHKSAVDRHVARNHPDSLVVRLDKIVGDDPAERHPFSEWWEAARTGRPVVCIANQVMSPTLVGDLARGIVTACRLGLRGVYNLTGPEFFPRDHLARHFFRIVGVPAEVVARPQAAFGFADPRPQNTYLDSTRFTAATGMRFTTMSEVMRRFGARARGRPASPRAA
jgi:dTDP-4-dehydrorhamnose reductase